jgi:hypothetical protein
VAGAGKQERAKLEKDDPDRAGVLERALHGDRILDLLRDYVSKFNLETKSALGLISYYSDSPVERELLVASIKNLARDEQCYDEILKALEAFVSASLQKKQNQILPLKENSLLARTLPRSEGGPDF